MCEEVHFSKFAGLQAYSWQLYYQMNSFTVIFRQHCKSPHAPPMYWLKPPLHQVLKSPLPPMFSTPMGNPVRGAMKTAYGHKRFAKLKTQFFNSGLYLNLTIKAIFPIFLVYPMHFNILSHRNEMKRVSLMLNAWDMTYSFILNSTWYKCYLLQF